VEINVPLEDSLLPCLSSNLKRSRQEVHSELPDLPLRVNDFRQNESKNYFVRRKSVVTTIGALILLATLSFPDSLSAQEVKFDSDSISGLGARTSGPPR